MNVTQLIHEVCVNLRPVQTFSRIDYKLLQGMFHGFNNVGLLNLHQNEIEEIEDESFLNKTRLRSLYLNNNNLTSINVSYFQVSLLPFVVIQVFFWPPVYQLSLSIIVHKIVMRRRQHYTL